LLGLGLLFDGEDKGSAFLGKVGVLVPDYTASHPKYNTLLEEKKITIRINDCH
jgi:hypothetical protein